MAKPRLHPENIAAAEERARDPLPMQPDRVEGTPDELETKAREQFDKARERYFPGFAFSDLPANFVLPTKDGWTVTASAGDLWRNKDRWSEIPAHLGDHPVGRVPKGWIYAKLVGNAEPHRFDLKNPRLYTLEGRPVPWSGSFASAGKAYTHPLGHFTSMLLDVFRTADPEAPNMRTPEVHAFLDHHRTNGGNPERFAEYVEELLAGWKAEPLARAELLNKAVESWLNGARNAPTSAKVGGKAKSKRPDLKRPTLADKLGEVLGATERFMALVRGAGLVNAKGRWIADNDTKGKGKLIAAWDAVVEVLKVPGFDTDAALVKALKVHFKDLEGLDRLDKVRHRKLYTERLEEYIADLQET